MVDKIKKPAGKKKAGRPKKKRSVGRPKKKRPVGRPKIKVDWETVDKMLYIQCTRDEIAGFLGISHDTLERRCKMDKKQNFALYSAEKRDGGKASLRRRQWLMAESNPTMAIWLGKQYLKQTDKVEQKNDVDIKNREWKLIIHDANSDDQQ